MKQGDKVKIDATVDAFRTGLNSGAEVRVKIGDTAVWVPESALSTESDKEE